MGKLPQFSEVSVRLIAEILETVGDRPAGNSRIFVVDEPLRELGGIFFGNRSCGVLTQARPATARVCFQLRLIFRFKQWPLSFYSFRCGLMPALSASNRLDPSLKDRRIAENEYLRGLCPCPVQMTYCLLKILSAKMIAGCASFLYDSDSQTNSYRQTLIIANPHPNRLTPIRGTLPNL